MLIFDKLPAVTNIFDTLPVNVDFSFLTNCQLQNISIIFDKLHATHGIKIRARPLVAPIPSVYLGDV